MSAEGKLKRSSAENSNETESDSDLGDLTIDGAKEITLRVFSHDSRDSDVGKRRVRRKLAWEIVETYDLRVLKEDYVTACITNHAREFMRACGLYSIDVAKMKPTSLDCWVLRSQKTHAYDTTEVIQTLLFPRTSCIPEPFESRRFGSTTVRSVASTIAIAPHSFA